MFKKSLLLAVALCAQSALVWGITEKQREAVINMVPQSKSLDDCYQQYGNSAAAIRPATWNNDKDCMIKFLTWYSDNKRKMKTEINNHGQSEGALAHLIAHHLKNHPERLAEEPNLLDLLEALGADASSKNAAGLTPKEVLYGPAAPAKIAASTALAIAFSLWLH